MDLQINVIDEISVVSISGNILHEYVDSFKKTLVDLVNQERVKIVLDFGSSNYISSICLATLIEIKKRVNERGGDLKLSRINKLLQDLLESTTLIRKFETFPDLESAVKSFT